MEPMIEGTIFLVTAVGIMLAGLAAYFVYIGKKQKKYLELIHKEADKRGGEVKGGSVITEPKLKFYLGSDTVKLHTVNGRYSVTTYITLIFDREINLKMNIHKTMPISKLGKALGLKDIELGDQDFDEKIVVKGNDEGKIRQILSFDIRQKLLSSILKFNLSFNLSNSKISVIFYDYLRSEEDFDEVMSLIEILKNKIKKR